MNVRWMNTVLYGIPILLFIVLFLVFDFNGLYGQDSHEYLRFAKALRVSWDTGADSGYFYWPKLFPALGALLSYLGIPVGLSLQLLSLVSLLGALFFAQRSIRFLYGLQGTWFLIIGAITQVYFVRSGLFVMSDSLALFFVMATFYFLLKTQKTQQWQPYIAVLLFATMAVFTRYAAAPLVCIPVLWSSWTLLSKYNRLWQILVVLGLGIVAVFLLLLNNQAWKLMRGILEQWHVLHLFQRRLLYEGQTLSYWVPNVIYIWSNFAHIGYLSCGVLLIPFVKRWNYQQIALWLGVLGYLVFIGGIGFQNQRFMVITHLWILILIFPAFQLLQEWLKRQKIWIFFVVGTLLFNAAFFSYSFSKLYHLHYLEKVISEEVNKLNDEPTVYSFYVGQSFESYEVPNPTQDLWMPIDTFELGGYVVFNPEKFEEPWKNSTLMKNWKILQEDYHLVVVKELPNNWRIYQIQ